MSPLQSFMAKCDAAAAKLGLERSALSNLLLFDSRRLDAIAEGKDIGVRRLAVAEADLEELLADEKGFRERRRRDKSDRAAA